MPELHFKIPLQPVAKGRPRFRVVAGHAQVYTPKETQVAEEALRLYIRNALPKDFRLLEGPIAAMLSFHIPFPKSMSKRKRLMAWPTTKPDLDNYEKLALDAMNQLVFRDDSQVVLVRKEKMYSDEPRWEIGIREIDIPVQQ